MVEKGDCLKRRLEASTLKRPNLFIAAWHLAKVFYTHFRLRSRPERSKREKGDWIAEDNQQMLVAEKLGDTRGVWMENRRIDYFFFIFFLVT